MTYGYGGVVFLFTDEAEEGRSLEPQRDIAGAMVGEKLGGLVIMVMIYGLEFNYL